MEQKKYKIAVFSDLKESTQSILQSSLGLAKRIGAEVFLLHVKKPATVVKNDNQLSALKSIKEVKHGMNDKMKKLIESLSNEYEIPINCAFAFGKPKDEILQFIKNENPDLVVIGKKKVSPISIFGDGITKCIIEKFDGTVMIASENGVLRPNEELSLGLLNGDERLLQSHLAENLVKQSSKPPKSFKIVDKAEKREEVKPDIIEYVFDRNDNSINNLGNYLLKSNVNLLMVPKAEKKPWNEDVRHAINKFNVTLMLAKA